ncbi:MAG: hypothetical protein IT382_22805 [Deltaproteobacteria bacterium]|nr:hypothetical protein [Deltaproteobacteria bacterium]
MRLRSTEDARRLARYDEAVRLLERVREHNQNWKELYAAIIDIQTFLAAEGKVAG